MPEFGEFPDVQMEERLCMISLISMGWRCRLTTREPLNRLLSF